MKGPLDSKVFVTSLVGFLNWQRLSMIEKRSPPDNEYDHKIATFPSICEPAKLYPIEVSLLASIQWRFMSDFF
jgi:hypothetical protein